MHAQDELYHGQRGPAENMHLLASAWSAKEKGGTGAHEPMLWVIPYGKGKVVTNVMGHENGKSLQCVGFVTLLDRSCEWLATGKVTTPVPAEFPTADKSSGVPK
jgi:type 1 glutamine amidotransferase